MKGRRTISSPLITLVAAALFLANPFAVDAQDFSQLATLLNGSKIIAQDDANTYLGKIASEYDSESIFNEYGTYGSEYSLNSVWNNYGKFGGEYSSYSPFNRYTSTPPMIIQRGKVIGYLTTNKSIKGVLHRICSRLLRKSSENKECQPFNPADRQSPPLIFSLSSLSNRNHNLQIILICR